MQSFIAADKTFCIYLAGSELLVREHSWLAGFPITKITEVPTVIDPMTGYSHVLDAVKAAWDRRKFVRGSPDITERRGVRAKASSFAASFWPVVSML